MELDKDLTAETVEYILQLDSVKEILSSISIDEEILNNQNEILSEIANKEFNTMQVDDIEQYYTEIIEVQTETLENIKSLFQVQFLLLGLTLGIAVVYVLFRGIFRNAGK
jgi:K+/H+ antiporter YhaU regulatory subunit KhtT